MSMDEEHRAMKFADNPERERILDQAPDARTLPEIATATRELQEWVRQKPEDIGIREAFEGLSLMQDIAEEQEAERAHLKRDAVAAYG